MPDDPITSFIHTAMRAMGMPTPFASPPAWYHEGAEKIRQEQQQMADQLAKRSYSWSDFGVSPENPMDIANLAAKTAVVQTSEGEFVRVPKKAWDETVGKKNKELGELNKRLNEWRGVR